MRPRRLPILIAIMMMSVGAAPPASPPDDGNDIVVTAVPKDPVELQKRVARFVGKVAESSTQYQLSRRMDGFCPKVLGIEDKYVPMVLARVREAGKAAKRTELAEGCHTNLLIIFTRDGDALMEGLRSKRPGVFLQQEPAKKRELFGSGRAVRWWYDNSGQDANGGVVGDNPAATNAMASAAELSTNAVYSSSLISTHIKISLTGNIVVVDVPKAEGYPLDAVASYVAMVSFAQVSARDSWLGDVPSVLGMFARTGPRITAFRDLTAWDRAYLSALYSIPMDRPLDRQRHMLATAMREAIVQQ